VDSHHIEDRFWPYVCSLLTDLLQIAHFNAESE